MNRLARLLLTIVLLFLCLSGSGCSATEQNPKITMYFFNNNPCESCREILKLNEAIAKQPENLSSRYTYSVLEIEAFKTTNQDLVNRYKGYAEKNGLKYEFPALVIGNEIMYGYKEMTDGIEAAMEKAAKNKGKSFMDDDAEYASPYMPTAQAEIPEVDKNSPYAVLFVTESCKECEKAKAYIADLPEAYTIREISIAEPQNTALMQSFFLKYNVPVGKQQVPILFMTDSYYSGSDDIVKNTLSAFDNGAGFGFTYPDMGAYSPDTAQAGSTTIWGSALSGLINGLNPCLLSMVLLLLSLIASSSKRFIKLGFSFLLGKYAAYLTIGITLYYTLFLVNFKLLAQIRFVSGMLLLVYSAVFAVVNVIDFFYAIKEQYGKIRLQLPVRFRQFSHALIKRIDLSDNKKHGALLLFVAGITISAGEFLCTGQIYLANILYMAQQNQQTVLVFAKLAIYVTALCIPASILVIMANKVDSIIVLSEFSRKNLPLIKLLNVVLFVCVAIIAAMMLL